MAIYLGLARYTAEAIKGLVANPEDRTDMARGVYEAAGGKLLSIYSVASGRWNIAVIAEFPDSISAQAAGYTILAGGAFDDAEFIHLQPVGDMVEALQKANQIANMYRPPGN